MHEKAAGAATAITTLLFMAATSSGAWAASLSPAHVLDLERARNAVKVKAFEVTKGFTTHFQHLDADGEGLRYDVSVGCARSGEHAARCRWRSFAYVGDEGSPVMSCSGTAVARLAGSRLRVVASAAYGGYCLR